MRLYLDIETLPAPTDLHEVFLSTLKEPPGTDEERREKIAETSLHGEFGRILCIGYLKEPGMAEPAVLTGAEPDQLRRFWEIARGVTLFVGHNLFDFDLPFLRKRSIVHRIRPLDISLARYRSSPVYDTMQEWSSWNPRERVRLDTIAKVLGLRSSKDGLDGSKVALYHEQGRDEEIFRYCKDDVRLVREVHRRMTFQE